MSNVSDSLPIQTANKTADVIRFPVRDKASPDKASPAPAAVVSPEVRLARALKSLSVALAEQRVVLTAWRDALAELKTTTVGLGASLTAYRDNLGALGESVLQLKAKAQALETLADTAVSKHS